MKNVKQKLAIALAAVLMTSSVPAWTVNAVSAKGMDAAVKASAVETAETTQTAGAESEEADVKEPSEDGASAEQNQGDEFTDGDAAEKEDSAEEKPSEDEGSDEETKPEGEETDGEEPLESEEEEGEAPAEGEQTEEENAPEDEDLAEEVTGEEITGKESSVSENDLADVYSLLPLEEKELSPDLEAYTPVELTMVPFSVIFAEAEISGADTVAYAYLDDEDDYTVSGYSETADISRNTYYDHYGRSWQMIPGGDQLDADAMRYIVRPKITKSEKWLIPTVYTQDETGSRSAAAVSEYQYYDWSKDDRELSVGVSSEDASYGQGYYLGLQVDASLYGGSVADMKVFEGRYDSADGAQAGTEITDRIFASDMSAQDAGYMVEEYETQWITVVSYDSDGNVTGCLPFYLYLHPQGTSVRNHVSVGSLFRKYEDAREYVSHTPQTENGHETITCELYAGYAADDLYCIDMDYYQNGERNNNAVTAAYADTVLYASIAEAESAQAAEVKESLFNDDYNTAGYEADYSQGVYFSIFIGEDSTEEQEVYHYCIRTREGIVAKNSGADVTFQGLCNAEGYVVDAYIIESKDDSYGGGSYPTILVNNDVDLSSLAPMFSTSTGVRLYAGSSPDANAVQTSGESIQDFSQGPVQYTTASENGENQKNCWLTVIKTDNVAAMEGLTYKLYTNSLADEESETYIDDNGVIRSRREVILYEGSEDGHDIFLVNMGTNVIPKLSAELESDTLRIDEYWTLNGNHDLAAFAGTEKTKYYGELPNLAKLRLKAKDSAAAGTKLSGTLTIKSDGREIMVLELTGVAGMPRILTESIPQAVKYVPYGTMIQNSNKYTENKITYALCSGTLPDGVEVMSNGEIYGVPKETGTFKFTVEMVCSMMPGHSVEQSFTLEVTENTDANVDGSTDEGYTVTKRIPKNIAMNSTASHTFVSEGVLGEFKKVFLDGEELGADEYEAESGSTRLTISSQTLAKSNTKGRHTLGVEFRTSEDTLMRAAQNYYLTDGNSGSDNNGGSNGGNNGTGDDAGNNGADTGNISGTGSAAQDAGNTAASGNGSLNMIGTGSTGAGGSAGGAASAGIGTAGGAAGASGDAVTYVVKAGDTLWKIAAEHYGDGSLWTKIYEDNRDIIRDANMIRVGLEIRIYPIQTAAVTALSDATGTAVTTYVVESGDTLWKIAKKLYGRGWQWRKIYDANADSIQDPGVLYVGQVIVIP